MVLCYHVHGMWLGPIDWLLPFTQLGAYGVDLFFVLSGYLIGGIYCRQRQRDGRVALFRFWGRRWMRTMPPYFAGLVLAWAAVFVHRREAFDPGYLFFLQNYYPEMPFFLVSWSLCVEEHFYLAMPILMAIAWRIGLVQALLTFVVVMPLVFRLSYGGTSHEEAFGFYHTATHLHMQGLALGVWAAYLRYYKPARWQVCQNVSRYLAIPLLVSCFSTAWWSDSATYLFANSLLSVGFAATLAAVTGRKPLPLADTKICYALAISSYSIYLTHALAIHAGRMIASKLPGVPELVMLGIWLILIGMLSTAFYFAFEWSSIKLRERWLPAKTKNKS